MTSLEGGYPIALPLGPRFVLEPQAQIIWQQVSFAQANDGLGPVALGTTSGPTGRVGLRRMWTIEGYDGQVWQPTCAPISGATGAPKQLGFAERAYISYQDYVFYGRKLKNAVDWGTRPYGKNSWAGKPGFITGTSPGAIGSALAQQHLRSVMVGLGMILLGGEAYVTFKPNLVDEDGNITDESTRKFLQGFLDRFISLVARLSQPDPH